MNQDQPREHRAQTNVAAICGVITKAPTTRLAIDRESGEVLATNRNHGGALEIAGMTLRVDRGDDTDFVEVEALGDLALSLMPLKRGDTVALSGRYEITSRKVEKDGQSFFYQNDKFRIVDRRVNPQTGEANADAPAPVILVEAATKHFFEVRFVGTVGKRGFKQQQVGNRMKSYGSIANNGTKASRPTWFDVSGWNDTARDLLGCTPSSLVEVKASPRKYAVNTPWGTSAKKIDMTARSVRVISAKPSSDGGPSLAVQSSSAALSVLALLGHSYTPKAAAAAPDAPEFAGSIDPGDGSDAGDHDGSEHLGDVVQGAIESGEAAPAAKRSRARRTALPAAA